MKKNIPSFLALALSFFLVFSLNAQDLLLSEDFVQADYTNVDLTNNFIDLETKITVTNNSTEVLELRWERIVVVANTPAEWQSQICDNNFCYGFETSTNYDPLNGMNDPFVLQPGESFDGFALHAWPRMTPGCGQYKVRFSRISAPNTILAVAHFDVSVNDADCTFLSSVKGQEPISGISLYPNPTSTWFSLDKSTEAIKSIAIFNLLGKRVKVVPHFPGDAVDVSDLPDGMYLVGLQNAEGQILKTLRLSKRGFRP